MAPAVTSESGEVRITGIGKSTWVEFVSESSDGLDLSGGCLTLHYRSEHALPQCRVELKLVQGLAGAVNTVAVNLPATGPAGRLGEIPLPETPGINGVGEVVFVFDRASGDRSGSLALQRLSVSPLPNP